MAVTDVSASAALETDAPPARSTWGLIQLSLFWIAVNFHWTIIPAIILPQEVQAVLFANHPAGLSGAALANYVANAKPGALAFVEGPGLLVALLSNPLFGWLSDRTRLRWGRRKPYILGGTLVNIVGLAIMALAPNLYVLVGGLMITQLGNNAAAAPFHAYLPDLVPAAQRGRASGYMGIGQMVGTIVGAEAAALFFHIDVSSLLNGTQTFAQYQQNLLAIYAFISAFVLLFALLTVFIVKERPIAERQDMPTATGMVRSNGALLRDVLATVGGILVATALTLGVLTLLRLDYQTDQNAANILVFPALIIGSLGVAKAFDFRPRQNSDFAWVLATRAIMMLGIYTVFGFLQYYLQDVTLRDTTDPAKQAVAASGNFLAIVIGTAAISTGFAGYLSDRFGRKRMVYIAGGFMALVGAIFIVLSLLFPSVQSILYISAAIFGLGYGSYISVDWALVTDVLPSEENYARDMGVWNIALTSPQVIAYIVGAYAIVAFNAGGIFAIGGQPHFGYTMLFVLLVLYALLGTVTVRFIKGVRR